MKKYILHPFHSWNIKIIKADDIYLYDENNKKYIDLTASAAVVNVGYNNAEIKGEMKKQMDKLIISPQTCKSDEAEALANKIYHLFPTELNMILRAVTGSEAVEIAIKIAVLYSRRDRLMSFDHSYHGQTISTLSLGNDRLTRDRFVKLFPKVKIVTPPYLLKSRGNLEEKSKKVLGKIEELFQRQKYAAFITEGLMTSAGCLPFGKNFFHDLSLLCKKHGVLLIFDEVLTGFGRTGKMFSFNHFNVVPDVVCISKGMGSGYVPIAAVVTKDCIGKELNYFSTYAWTPLACVSANKNIDLILANKLVENSKLLGEFALNKLKKELRKDYIIDIRGMGLQIGIELLPLCNVDDVIKLCMKNGVFLSKADLPNTFVIHPPLNISKNILDKALDVVIGAIKYSAKV